MALTNSTSLASLVGEIVANDVQSAAYATRVMRPLIRNYAVPPGAGSIVVPRFKPVSVQALTEGVAPGSKQMQTVGVTLTPQERGAYVQISKRALHADPFQDLAPYGEQLGRSLAEDEDAQIIGSLAFTEKMSTAGALNLQSLLDAIAKLEENNVPGPYFAVFHPASWAKLRGELSDASVYASVGQRTVEGFGEGFTNANGFVGMPFGIPCFISTQITSTPGATPVRQNVVFGREAAAVAYIRDIGVDVDDNVVARALDLMAWYSVDVDTLVDGYGIALEDTE
jgi:hypothetical protein